jgi:hypothetical protein
VNVPIVTNLRTIAQDVASTQAGTETAATLATCVLSRLPVLFWMRILSGLCCAVPRATRHGRAGSSLARLSTPASSAPPQTPAGRWVPRPVHRQKKSMLRAATFCDRLPTLTQARGPNPNVRTSAGPTLTVLPGSAVVGWREKRLEAKAKAAAAAIEKQVAMQV